MIEYLEKLISEKDYRKALEVAERMLGEGRREARELLVINSAIFQSRLVLREYLGAVEVGPVVLRLARELQMWDTYGATCVDLSVTYHDLDRHPEAIQVLNQYLSMFSQYEEARNLETHAWYNLGRSLMVSRNYSEATKAYDRAIEAGGRLGQHRLANAARHALIEVLLQVPDFGRIPRLLAQAARYLRVNSDDPQVAESKLFHIKLRAEFAFLTSRYRRARCIIASGLLAGESKPRHLFNYHLLLAQMAVQIEDLPAALDHALSAKIHAVHCRRHDLEAKANRLGHELVETGRLA